MLDESDTLPPLFPELGRILPPLPAPTNLLCLPAHSLDPLQVITVVFRTRCDTVTVETQTDASGPSRKRPRATMPYYPPAPISAPPLQYIFESIAAVLPPSSLSHPFQYPPPLVPALTPDYLYGLDVAEMSQHHAPCAECMVILRSRRLAPHTNAALTMRLWSQYLRLYDQYDKRARAGILFTNFTLRDHRTMVTLISLHNRKHANPHAHVRNRRRVHNLSGKPQLMDCVAGDPCFPGYLFFVRKVHRRDLIIRTRTRPEKKRRYVTKAERAERRLNAAAAVEDDEEEEEDE